MRTSSSALEFGSTPTAHLAFAAAAMVRLRIEPRSQSLSPQGMLLWVTADSASAEEKEEEAQRGEEESEKDAEPPALEAKYLIVGGGTAAFSAIKELKRLDPNAKVIRLRWSACPSANLPSRSWSSRRSFICPISARR